MRIHIILVLLIGLCSGSIYAQSANSSVYVGDTFIIGEVNQNNYKHIDFPKDNFILKKGGVANYNNIKGKRVEVTSIKKKPNGRLIATIKLTSNKRFFTSHRYITVDIPQAIDQKELVRI